MRRSRVSRLLGLGTLAAGVATEAAAAGSRLATSSRDAAADRLHAGVARRLASSLGEMKALPMKMGQMLSYIDDAVPPEHRAVYHELLGTLRAQAPTVPWSELEPVITADLGPIAERFAAFNTEPVAAASIGQVYRGVLIGGQNVAIKVQYPGIAEAIESDLANASMIASTLSRVLRNTDVHNMLEDVVARIGEEVDYRTEAENQRAFCALWERDPQVVIPKVHLDLCTDRVLVTDWDDGLAWDKALATLSTPERQRAGQVIYRFVYRSLYDHGLLNADPHPGNYLFHPDGRVTFLDFGCVQRFSDDATAHWRRLRDACIAGLRGPALRPHIAAAFGVGESVTDVQWAIAEKYVLLTLESVVAPQPFTFDRDYTRRLMDVTISSKARFVRDALRHGFINPTQEGVVFLTRLNFGVASVLSELGTTDDFRALLGIPVTPPLLPPQ